MRITLSEVISIFHVEGDGVLIDAELVRMMHQGAIDGVEHEELAKRGVQTWMGVGSGVRGLEVEGEVVRRAEVYLSFLAVGPGVALDEDFLRIVEGGAIGALKSEALATRKISKVDAKAHGFHAIDTVERFQQRLGAVRGDKSESNVASIAKPVKKKATKKKAAKKP